MIPKPSELALWEDEVGALLEIVVVAAVSDGPMTGRELEIVREIGARLDHLVRRAPRDDRGVSADIPVSPEGPYRGAAIPVDDDRPLVLPTVRAIDAIVRRSETYGWRDRMWTAGERVEREIVRELAFRLAAFVVLHDSITEEEELELVKKLRTSLRLDRDTAHRLLGEVAVWRETR